MENQKYLHKLHTELLVIMDEIDRVCSKNGLRYYLIGGTLLGAVRHNGFIPWDDDLDIVMPREDLNKLIAIFKQELNPSFKLEWYGNKKGYYQFFPKISKRNTLFMQEGIKQSVQSGIFVDIFPLDLSPEYTSWLDNKKLLIRRYAFILNSWHYSGNTFKLNMYKCLRAITPKYLYLWLIADELKKIKAKGQTHYANFGSQYKLQKQTMPIQWYGDGIKLQFEDRRYCVPTEYKKILERIFGQSYMELPPIAERRTHYPRKVIFSDGAIYMPTCHH